MSGTTYEEINERISEIDSLIFRADTGQISLAWEQYASLHEDGETLMKILAEGLALQNGSAMEEMYRERDKVRRMNRLVATAERDLELHPEPNPREDAIIKAACNDKTKTPEQVTREIESVYAYMFANKPVAPANRKSLLQRIFRR
jgi:hypothetical protein